MSDQEVFENFASIRFRELEAERHAADPNAPPFVVADRGFRNIDMVRVPPSLAERNASARRNAEASDFCSMRMRVEGAIGRIKSWQVASAKFRSPNRVFHCDCIVVAAMLAEFIHDRHHHNA
jgi:hypothetical protein